jgi:flagellar motor switch protein FliM
VAKILDFTRPDKFSKSHIHALQKIFDSFVHNATTGLSAHLRALVGLRIASVDQLTLEEFFRSIPNPTTVGVFNMKPLDGSAIIEMDPSITFAMIDRMFGGKGETAKINRELSDIEMKVMEVVLVRLIGNLRDAMSPIINLKPELTCIETNPQFAQIVSPNDIVLIITFETKIGYVGGMTNLCIPHSTIAPILNRLSVGYLQEFAEKEEKSQKKLISIDELNKHYHIEIQQKYELKTNWLSDGFKKGHILKTDLEQKGIARYSIQTGKQEATNG